MSRGSMSLFSSLLDLGMQCDRKHRQYAMIIAMYLKTNARDNPNPHFFYKKHDVYTYVSD